MGMESLSCDILIIGSGAAGLRAAIAAREEGCDTCVVCKGSPGKGTSTFLSGGVFAGTREGDLPQVHREQTLQAGRGINDPNLVEVLVSRRPLRDCVRWSPGECRAS